MTNPATPMHRVACGLVQVAWSQIRQVRKVEHFQPEVLQITFESGEQPLALAGNLDIETKHPQPPPGEHLEVYRPPNRVTTGLTLHSSWFHSFLFGFLLRTKGGGN